jgi:hypothetical protein
MKRALRRVVALGLVSSATALAPDEARAAPEWVDRGLTLPRHDFAFDAGIGIGHTSFGNPRRNVTGPGLNLEGAFAITDSVELGLRTGLRFGDDARAIQADNYGRTLWTETWGTRFDTVANPEARVRWAFYSGRVVEVGLDGRAYLPIEDNSRIGMMFGLPLAFHIGSTVRIDMGVYVPVVFYDQTFAGVTVPGYFWFQVSRKVWLGPMTSLRFIDPGPGNSYTDLLLGFGLGVQVASAVDLKTWLLFPRINQDEGARTFGAGFGVQLRIE